MSAAWAMALTGAVFLLPAVVAAMIADSHGPGSARPFALLGWVCLTVAVACLAVAPWLGVSR